MSENKMQVEVLKKDGKVMFVEAGSDFADFLTATLQQPLGAIVGLDTDASSFGNLSKSVNKMRGSLFLEKPEASKVKPIDLKKVVDGRGCQSAGPLDVLQGNCTVANKQVGADGKSASVTVQQCSGNFQGIAFAAVEEGFEMCITYPYSQSYGFMMGFFPASEAAATLITQDNQYTKGFFLYAQPSGWRRYSPSDNAQMTPDSFSGAIPNNRAFRIRVTKSNGGDSRRMEADFQNNGTWQQIPFSSTIPDGDLFPAMLFHANSTHNAHITLTRQPDVIKPVFQPYCKFLVANDLAMCESTSLKALEILQKNGIGNVESLKVETVAVTETMVKRLLGRAMCGEKDVLQFAFGGEGSGSSRRGGS
eukprot:g2242.t1